MIRRARPGEAAFLHDLTGRSALHWGYEAAFLEWEPEAIAVSPGFLARSVTNVLDEDGVVTGYYALIGDPPALSLDKLFVEPRLIGTGRGQHLWRHAVTTARAMGATVLTLAANPNAAPFHRAMGAEWLREEETTWPGWNLQLFSYPLLDKPS